MKFQHRIYLLLACCLCASIAFSQVKITGNVVDAAGEPIEFATVRLLGTAVGTNTDTKGLYEMTVPKADTIMVEFSCLGYSTVTRQLIKPEGTVTINPKLYEKTLELGEVEITEYEEIITPLKVGPVKIPCLEFGTVNVGRDYSPEWKMGPLPPLKPL